MIKINKERLPDILIPSAFFLTAFLWKYINAGSRDICLDEPFTIFHAQESIKNILLLPTQDEPNPPLFMFILHFWIQLFGNGPFAVRVLPIFFNALTTVFLYFTGKKFFGIWSGIIASGLFLFSTYHFFFGGDTRAYSMLSCAAAASLYFFLSTLKNPDKKINTIALIISNLFLVYSHYFGLFIIFVQFLTSFLFLKEKKGIRNLWIAFGITGLLYIPMAGIILKQFIASSTKGTWLAPPAKTEFINQLKWFLNSENGFVWVIILIGIGIIVAIVTKVKPVKWKEIIVLFVWWIVPYSIMFFVSEKIPMFTNRYILFNTIGFYLFIGALINILYQKTKYLLPLISLGICAVSFNKMETQNFAVREIKKSTEYIHEKFTTESLIVIFPQWANLGFVYYFNPELFSHTDNYYSILRENGILSSWGLEDALSQIEPREHNRIIYYHNNAKTIDPSNSIYNYLDSLYIRVEEVQFEGGIIVDIFDKKETSSIKSTNQTND
ncbi:MAG: glycosyltransferase family 39 protein [Bacteroidales bacterium]|nr:glycosyltransferase family 39 protein [Bacteroidales bacterium]